MLGTALTAENQEGMKALTLHSCGAHATQHAWLWQVRESWVWKIKKKKKKGGQWASIHQESNWDLDTNSPVCVNKSILFLLATHFKRNSFQNMLCILDTAGWPLGKALGKAGLANLKTFVGHRKYRKSTTKGTLNAFQLNGCIKYNVRNINPANADALHNNRRNNSLKSSKKRTEWKEWSVALTWQSKSWKLRAFCKRLYKQLKFTKFPEVNVGFMLN